MGFEHPDSRIRYLFGLWTREGAQTRVALNHAGELFGSMAELESFFQLAFPGCTPVEASGSTGNIADGTRRKAIQVKRALRLLNRMNAKAELLQPAAYLVHDADDLWRTNREHVLNEPGQDRKMSEFLYDFRDVTAVQLREAFNSSNWRDKDISRWIRQGFKAGVDADAMTYLLAGAYGRIFLSEWPAQRVAELLEEGVSVEYLRHFWAFPREFNEAWADRIPFEFAAEMVTAES